MLSFKNFLLESLKTQLPDPPLTDSDGDGIPDWDIDGDGNPDYDLINPSPISDLDFFLGEPETQQWLSTLGRKPGSWSQIPYGDHDGDGIPNVNDPQSGSYDPNHELSDYDLDGTLNINDPFHPTYQEDHPDSDMDGDGIINKDDPDADGDGMPDDEDDDDFIEGQVA